MDVKRYYSYRQYSAHLTTSFYECNIRLFFVVEYVYDRIVRPYQTSLEVQYKRWNDLTLLVTQKTFWLYDLTTLENLLYEITTVL